MPQIKSKHVFDTIDCEMLWRVIRKFGCPRKLFAVVKAFHINMSSSVAIGGDETEYFKLKVDVKQRHAQPPPCSVKDFHHNLASALVSDLMEACLLSVGFREKQKPLRISLLTYFILSGPQVVHR